MIPICGIKTSTAARNHEHMRFSKQALLCAPMPTQRLTPAKQESVAIPLFTGRRDFKHFVPYKTKLAITAYDGVARGLALQSKEWRVATLLAKCDRSPVFMQRNSIRHPAHTSKKRSFGCTMYSLCGFLRYKKEGLKFMRIS